MQPLIHAVPIRRRQRGGAVLHTVIFLLGAATGWVGWQAALTRSPLRTSFNFSAVVPEARAATAAPTVNTATNGALIIPVRDSSGTVREPLVLLPVQARLRPDAGLGVPAPGPSSVKESSPLTNSPVDKVLLSQIHLVRQGFSPGSIDGLMGGQTRAALRAFQQREGLPTAGQLDDATLGRLASSEPVYTNYVVAPNDLERLLPLSRTWLAKSQQARLDYESLLELVAELSFSHPHLIRRLNPAVNWTNISAGTALKVPAVYYPVPAEKAAFLRIRLAERTLQAFGATSNLLAHFPCSIAQRVEKRPVGEGLHVAVVAPDPNYTFDPAVFPESAEARELGRKLILQPGPNNPVGSVWIGLDKPGYGIHGTPKPEEVGRTESHGCFRLANWNVRYLLDLVTLGTPVEVVP